MSRALRITVEVAIGAFLLCDVGPLAAQQSDAFSPEALSFYENSVRPVLRTCLPCHSVKNRTSGLALDSRDEILAGGNRGSAVQLGSPDESLMIQAIEHKGGLKMPPGGRLKDEQITALRRWIQDGLAWPADATPRTLPGWDHWAFQAPKRHELPAVKDTAWVRNPIDRFILARLEKENVKPSPEADRNTLLRRLSLDLTGLPPTPKELEAFLNDKSPDAYEKVVDRLLASPHYGERWGRHWLDIARYADSDGYTIDGPRQMWKYRDWVINALNRDLPFDQFVIDQIAGDMLPNATVDQLIATGFHRNTPSNFEGGIDFEQYRVEAVADRVATTGAAFLGLTLGCARCHDHKYDPVTQREFYQLFAFYNNTDEITTEAERYDFHRPVLELPTPEEEARREAFRAQVRMLSRELTQYVKELSAKPVKPGDPPKHEDAGLMERVANLRALRRRAPQITTTLVMRELPKPRDAYIHLNGDFLQRGVRVSPGVPAVLASKPVNGTRVELAKWLVSPENPLTARVTVNRMWQTYFGKGIVETENDFGLLGAKPTHPELLDWLALEFIERGWSQKAIHRLIVTSSTYRQSSRNREDLDEIDPYNKLLARQTRMRLEAEILRDSALVASDLFVPVIGGPSVYPPLPDGALAVTQIRREWPTATGPDRYRRGMYTFFFRSAPHPALGLFDAPDASATCTQRTRSNSPLQALILLNDEAYIEFARSLAKRVVAEGGATDREKLEYAFLRAVARKPSAQELSRLERFLALQRDEYQSDPTLASHLVVKEQVFSSSPGGRQSSDESVDSRQVPELAAWTAVARVLFNLDDFVTRE
ncbi:MAG: PSD1 and planctomycete cytochrome C domain-containing protein [Bryobacteraceae bacterium]